MIISEGRVLLHRRSERGLLSGMWELPGVEDWITLDQAVHIAVQWGVPENTAKAEMLKDGRHVFSHVEWLMKGIKLEVPAFEAPPEFLWADARQLREDFALPSAFRPFAEYLPK